MRQGPTARARRLVDGVLPDRLPYHIGATRALLDVRAWKRALVYRLARALRSRPA